MAETKHMDKRLEESINFLFDKLNGDFSEAYKEWRKYATQFWSYSWGNQIRIMMQCNHATHVAGYRKWQQLCQCEKTGELPFSGKPVLRSPLKEGEYDRPIYILAPLIGPVKDKDTGEKIGTRMFGFKEVRVYDISQVANPPNIPTIFSSVGDGGELWNATIAAIEESGIGCAEAPNSHGAEAVSYGGRITYTKRELPYLFHEWEHEIRHQGENKKEYTINERELHAQGVADLVCSVFGIDCPWTGDYLKNWSNDVEDLKEHLPIIVKDAQSIIKAVQAQLDQKVEVAA